MANLSCIYTLSDKINLQELSKDCNLPEGVELSDKQVISSLYKIAAKRNFPAAEYEDHLEEIYSDLIDSLYMHDSVYIEDSNERVTYNENADTLRFNLRIGFVLDYLRKLHVVHKFHDSYYVSKVANDVFDIKKAQSLISSTLKKVGLPEDALKIHALPGGSFRVIPANSRNSLLYNNQYSEHHIKTINTITEFLQERFPALKGKIHYISAKEAKNILQDSDKKVDIDEVNSFVKEGEVYLIKGRVTRDSAVEECLHPFVKAIELSNNALFNHLYASALIAFPTLKGEVEITYTDDKGFKELDKQNEVVTKALVKYFSGEFDYIESSKEGRKSFLDYVNEFLTWFRNLFAPINPKTQNHIIEIEDLNTQATFSDLADLLNLKDIEIHGIDNSELAFSIRKIESFIKQNSKAVCVSKEQAEKLSSKGFTVYNIKDEDIYVVNIPEGVDIERVEHEGQVKTLEDHVRTIEEAIKILKTKVSKGENFETEHKYNITVPGKKSPVQNNISVTEKAEELAENPKYNKSTDAKGELILEIGNSFDTIVRDFFLGKKTGPGKVSISNNNVRIIQNTLKEKFIPFLDSKFGKDKYKVITSEMLLAGKIGKDEKGQDKYIAGATDMIIVTSTGDIWIVDMKTTGRDTGIFNRNKDSAEKKKKQYGYQLLLYKELLKQNFPQLADKIKGTVLLVGTRTNIPDSVIKKEDGKYYNEDTNELAHPKLDLIFNDSTIEQGKNWISVGDNLSLNNIPLENIELNINEVASDSYIESLINQYNKIIEEKKKKINAPISSTPSPEENAIVKDDLGALSPSERTYLGRQIMILISNTCDEISKGSPYVIRMYPELKGLVGKTPSEILRSTNAFDIIVEKIVQEYFEPLLYTGDPIMQNKVEWVRDNIKFIINESISEIINIEHVTIGGNSSVTVDGQEDNLQKLYDLAEIEDSFKEGYYIENREVSFESLVPKELKRRLSKIKDPNSEEIILFSGESIVRNKYGYLGIPDFLDKHYVLDALTDNLHMCHSYSAMLEKMNTLKEEPEYKWLNDVIEMLENDLELQSLFVRTFWKDKVIYTEVYDTQLKDKTEYTTKILNAQEGRGSLKENWEDAKYTSGIFTIDDSVEQGGDKLTAKKEWKDLYTTSKNKKLTEEEKTKVTFKILKALSFDYVNIKKASKDSKVQTNLEKIIKSTSKSIQDVDKLALNLINSILPYYHNASEQTVYSNGKTYSTYVEPSELGTILADLGNPDSDIYDSETGEFKKDSIYKTYSYYSINNNREDLSEDTQWINSWLEILNNPSKRKDYIGNVYANTSTLDSNFNDQDSRKYLINILCSYAAPSKDVTANELGIGKADSSLALFRVATMSDKNAEDSILFYKPVTIKSVGNDRNKFHKKAAEKVYGYFLYEIKRMEAIVDAYREGREDDLVDIWKPKGINLKDDVSIDSFLDENGNLKKEFLESGMAFRYLYALNDVIFSNSENINADAKIIRDYILARINNQEIDEVVEGNLMTHFSNVFISDMQSRYKEFKQLAEKLITPEDIESILGDKSLLEEFYWNDTIATMNILNITIQDPSYFKNVIDFQKRFAQMHASAAKPNIEAKFETNDGKIKKYSADGLQRVVIIEDDVRNDIATMGKQIEEAFKKAAKRYPKDSLRRLEMETLASTVPPMFEEVVSTDGQSFASPTSFWKKLGMLGEDTKGIREILNHIRDGNFNIGNINTVIQAFKPFVTAKVDKPLDNNFGNELVPIQIKNSEAMILLHGAIMEGLKINNENPISVIFNLMEASAYGDGVSNLKKFLTGKNQGKHNDSTYNGKGIDTVVFRSAVKNGVYKVLDLNGKNKSQMLQELSKIIEGDDYSQTYVKSYPITKWGKQQNNPPHMQDNEQARGSQVTILSVSDIPEDAEITVKGQTKNKKTFINDYLNLLKDDYNEGMKEVATILGLNDGMWKEKLAALLINSLNRDGRYSREMRNAFTLINGEFILPIGDPIIADKVYSTIFNVIKDHVNNSEMPGGPVVQVSPFAYNGNSKISKNSILYNESLQMREDSESGGYIFDAYITCPTREIEKLVVTEDGTLRSPEQVQQNLEKEIKDKKEKLEKTKKNTKKLEKDIKNLEEKLTRFNSYLEFIAYRIPTEDKYSIFKCRIKGFLPRQCGEVVILPRDIVPLSGTDFDIDKLYCMFRYGTPKSERESIKDSIFEHMWGALSHESTAEKSLNPGGFQVLKDLARDVDPNFGNIKMDITKVETQLRLHESNAAGKTFVGIAALNNVSHAISTFSPIAIDKTSIPSIAIEVEGKVVKTNNSEEFGFIGNVYSPFDGSRISRTLGMFVGASADNAKEAVLQSINITPITANIAMTILRYGIPLKTVVYMMNIPRIKKLAEKAEMSGERFEDLLNGEAGQVQPDNHFISNNELLRIIRGEAKSSKTEAIVVHILQQFIPIAKDLSAFNQIASLGSAKNAVGPRIYDVIKKIAYIKYAEQSMDNSSVLNFGDIFKHAPHLEPLARCYTEIVPNYCSKFSPLFTSDFEKLLSLVVSEGGIDALTDKNIKNLLDTYLLFKNKLMNSIQDDEGNIAQPDIDIFKTSMQDKGLIPSIRERRNQDIPDLYNMLLEKLVISKNITRKVRNNPNVIFKNSGKSRELKDDLAASWIELSQSNTELSNQLLEYMLTRFGFSWMPNSAIGIAPNKVKLSYGYHELFDYVLDNNNELNIGYIDLIFKEYIKNFIPYGIVKSVDDLKQNAKGFIKYKGKLYLSEDGENKIEINKLGIPNQFIEINLSKHEHSVITNNNIHSKSNKKERKIRIQERDSTPEKGKAITENIKKKNIEEVISNVLAGKDASLVEQATKSVEATIKKENLCKHGK